MRLFLQSFFPQILLTFYIYWRGRQALSPKSFGQILFTVLLGGELLLFLTGYLFHQDLPDSLLVPILYICNTWFVASLYLTMLLLSLEAVRLIQKRHSFLPKRLTRNPQQTQTRLFLAIVFTLAALMGYGYYTARHPVVKHVHLTISKQAAGRDSLKIVLMTDLHLGEMIGKKELQRFVALSNAQQPDLVVLGGDILDYESRYAEKAHLEEILKQLKAPLGVYIINGNHEFRANRETKRRWLLKTGGILLVDSVSQPDKSFYLIGRDDFINKGRKSLYQLLWGLDRKKPLIVLDHQPAAPSEIEMNRVDLSLHGHTHNGQIWPNSWRMKFIWEWPYGLYRKGNSQAYVSSGIGFSGSPYRIGTHAELVVLHLRFDTGKSL
ncbi:metallophosphoesterase [Parabacteroides sp. Marseille-P3160]|uniref:metallophosphoesterase n=1 Tax=Parabacteroides sp. Marseille-P3160 TaxID=1917887 RepID=UPI0009B97FCF|nr:metallophosphoesterase [Parabacteroides sp. Marseille-P3160]